VGGLIFAVTPSANVTEGVLPSAWDAVSFGGKVYNTDLVATPPAGFTAAAILSGPRITDVFPVARCDLAAGLSDGAVTG
jgi:hypothetical protein